MTSFPLGVWVYQTTGSITQFALISFSIVLPSVAFGPLAGALVDRWDRRQVMIISDTGGCLSILSVIILFLFGNLESWHIYLAVFIAGIFDTLRWPAFTAATTQLVSKEQIGRSSGMLKIIQASTGHAAFQTVGKLDFIHLNIHRSANLWVKIGFLQHC